MRSSDINDNDDDEACLKDQTLCEDKIDIPDSGSDYQSDNNVDTCMPSDSDDTGLGLGRPTPLAPLPPGMMRGKRGMKSCEDVPRQRRRRPQDTVREMDGPTAAGRVNTVLQSVYLFFTYVMVNLICLHTNEEGDLVHDEYNQAHPKTQKQFTHINQIELHGCIGFLYLLGIYRGRKEP